jgi:hypothetical protein
VKAFLAPSLSVYVSCLSPSSSTHLTCDSLPFPGLKRTTTLVVTLAIVATGGCLCGSTVDGRWGGF